MTREERKAERKAYEARVAVYVFAKQMAKRKVQNDIRACGGRLSDLSNKELTIRAEQYVAEHPEIVAEARVRAAECGYV